MEVFEDSYSYQFIETNGINLHVVLAGPEEGEMVIFLHGFPEFWYGWRGQIDFFAEQGYRVVVPDQRGYNLSDKPRRIRDYDIGELGRDIVGLIDHFGKDNVLLVGHDWGGRRGLVDGDPAFGQNQKTGHPECASSGGDARKPV